mgnify:CR=1 FL=1
MKKIFALLAVLALLTAGCTKEDKSTDSTTKTAAPATAEKQIKAGFIYVGPVGDAGWTWAHDQGRIEMEKAEYVSPSTFIESVPEGAESTRVINGLVQKGHNLIFTTSFGYMDAPLDVASKNKDVVFMHCTGYKSAENVGTYFGRMYEPRYLSGIIAGKMTKTNSIGYVAAFPIPEVIRGINAFTLGLPRAHPAANVPALRTQLSFDPGAHRAAAATPPAARPALRPRAMLPRPSPSADGLHDVVSGEFVMGTRDLGPGAGFCVPAAQPYAYQAGSEGVVILEFRHSTAFDTKFHEKDPARFRAKAEASLAEAASPPTDPAREA